MNHESWLFESERNIQDTRMVEFEWPQNLWTSQACTEHRYEAIPSSVSLPPTIRVDVSSFGVTTMNRYKIVLKGFNLRMIQRNNNFEWITIDIGNTEADDRLQSREQYQQLQLHFQSITKRTE